MAAYRYRTEIAGVVRVGLEFDSDAELDAFLDGRGLVVGGSAAVPVRNSPSTASLPQKPGRPSFDAAIAAALAPIGAEIDRCDTLRAAAGLVQRAMATGGADPNAVPGAKTIERYLANHRPRQNKGQNPGQKSKRAIRA